LNKVVITPQGFAFVKDSVSQFFDASNQYTMTNGIVSDKKKLKNLLSDAHAVIIGSEKIDRVILESAKNLKLIVRFGTTTENIDVNYAQEKGIKVFSIKSKFTVAGVGRLCMSFLLNYSFNIQKHISDARLGDWTRYMNMSPANTTVGLVGAGDIAYEFLQLGQNLGFRFVYHSRKANKEFDELGAEFYASLSDLIKDSDVVSLHVPLNASTQNLINSGLLALFKDKLLINTSRAGVVDQQKLREMIFSDPTFFYFTDVLGAEPPGAEDIELIKRSNVLSSAHIGGYSYDALFDVAKQSLDIIRKEL